MLAPLFGYFFSMITMLTTFVVLLTSFSSISPLGKGRHHLRPPEIGRTVTVDQAAQWRSPVALERSPEKDGSAIFSTAKAETQKSKHHKPKVVTRQYNNYGYGNALGYAQETGYGPRGLFLR
jgi:hypothetical protein